jgi:capsular exopolysaccharide synthesis family protein
MDLKTYLNPLLKWWWLIIIAAVLAGISSYLIVRNDPAIYQSRTSLMVGRPLEDLNPSGNEFSLGQQLAGAYADIAKRESVRESTKEALGMDSLPPYTINVPDRTQLIEITVTDTNPERARVVANELANQLVQLSPSGLDSEEEERQRFLTEQLDYLEVQIDATQEEIFILQTELGDLISASEIANSQNQIQALQNKLNALQGNYSGFLASTQETAVNVITIMEPAFLPTVPTGSNKTTTIIMTVVFGVIIASAAAYLMEYLDDTVQSPEDVKKITGRPVLASVSKIDMGDDDRALVALNHPRAPASEAFRELRTNVQFLGSNKASQILLSTSPSVGDGKSFTTANLAVVMAQAGFKTIIVDADLRHPSQHKNFDLKNSYGLSDLVLAVNFPGRGNLNQNYESVEDMMDRVVLETGQGGLYMLTCGSVPPNPSELIGSKGMKAIMQILVEQYDYVIIDSPPCLYVTDPMILSTLADSVLMVIHAGRTRRKDLEKGVAQLEGVDANLQGIVMNHQSSWGGNYYQTYYGERADSSSDSPIESKPVPSTGYSLRRQVSNIAESSRGLLERSRPESP